MALKTIARLLEDVQDAIDKVYTSQEYELGNRKQKLAMLQDLNDRSKFLVAQGEAKGFDSTLAGSSGRGSFSVRFN